jgi:hypothetical protein
MSSNALESQGTTLKIATLGSPATFVAIPDVRDINFRTGSATVIDTTDLSATTAKTKRMGLPDEGQLTFTLMFRPQQAQHAELVAAKADRKARNFRVVLTDASPATEYEFAGYVLSIPISAAVDGVIESNVTVEIDGPVTEV